MDINTLIENLPTLLISYAVKIALAIVIYVVGKWLANLTANMISKGMTARSVDITLTQFTHNIIYYLGLTIVIISALGQLGVQTASFVAIVGAAGLAVGFALQGSLSNFASGVLMIVLRPCKIGDYVEVGGTSGTVRDIAILATTLLTPDNKTVIVSNSAVMGGNIVNYSTQAQRRVDLVVGVSYSADIQQVKNELEALVNADSRILQDPAATIAVSELADSSVNFVLRPWVKTEDYWGVYFDLTEAIKCRFDEVGIEIPFPQMDVHTTQAAA
jgi:small conductance mechanosensitive channel